MVLARDMNDSLIIDSRYGKSMPRGFLKRITVMLSPAVGMSRAMNGFEVSTTGTRWKLMSVSPNCGHDVVDVVVHAAQDGVRHRLLGVAAVAGVAVDLLDPFEVDDRHHADLQVDVGREVDLIGLHAAVQALVEQQVGVDRRVLPRGEGAGRLAPRRGLGVVVQVQAGAATPFVGIGAELPLELGPFVRVRPEVAHRAILALRGGDPLLHRLALVAVEGVTLDGRGSDAFAAEDRVEGALDGAGAGAAGAGDRDDGMPSGHVDATGGWRTSGAHEQRARAEQLPGHVLVGVVVVAHDQIDFVARADDHRHALVQRVGHHVEQLPGTGDRTGAGLLHQERHRRGFVHQPQATRLVRRPGVARIEEHAATAQDAVHLGDQARDPAHVEVLAARTGLARQALGHVALHRLLPEALVRRVDRELARLLGHPDRVAGEPPVAVAAIERERCDAVAAAEHHHAGRAVDHVAGCDLAATRLQEASRPGRRAAKRMRQDREDGAHRDVGVDVRRSVERIEDHQELAGFGVLRRDRRLFVFLAGPAGDVPAAGQRASDAVVGEQVEPGLHLALAVAVFGVAVEPGQLAESRRIGNARARSRQRFDGGGQGRRTRRQPVVKVGVCHRDPPVNDRDLSPDPVSAVVAAAGSSNTRLARMSAAAMVDRSSSVSARSRSANRRLAWRSRARSSALRTLRALAKCGWRDAQCQVLVECLRAHPRRSRSSAAAACARRSPATRPRL